jgi:tRNA pseudouridine38-40 synthase
MAPYQLILAYDGTNFSGFQRQNLQSTIQGSLETALRQVGWNGNSILAAGRTDAGVHASGQVVKINLDWRHSPNDLCNALNANLPEDISVRSVAYTDEHWHPRFDAVSRTYCYQLFFEPVRNPLKERFAWRVWPLLDQQLLQRAAQIFVGTFDFCTFGSPVRSEGSTVRTVYESFWTMAGQYYAYRITANAFLYHMVRRIVFYQVQAASGKISIEDLEKGLSGIVLENNGLAPAKGLFLEKVSYKD